LNVPYHAITIQSHSAGTKTVKNNSHEYISWNNGTVNPVENRFEKEEFERGGSLEKRRECEAVPGKRE